MVYVEAGTIHAIGPGMVVLETQQYSDTTYRLYDYGRPRELHLKDGLAVTKSHTKAGPVAPVEKDGFTRLISTQYFVVDRFAVGASQELGLEGQMQILIALNEGASVRVRDGKRFAVPAGRAVVLPARSDGGYALEGEANAEVVRISTGIR
jgi:mannose-6-phosphate isomerase